MLPSIISGSSNPRKPKRRMFTHLACCVWFLFGNRLSDIPQTSANGTVELISFNSHLLGRRTLLEDLKDEDRVQDIANHFVELTPGLNVEYKIRLKEISSLTLPLDPGKRTSDLARVIGLLGQNG